MVAQSPVSIGTFTPATSRYLLDTKHTFNAAQSQAFTFLTYAAGDKTLVGDWNNDGRAKLGVYRNGTFYLDYNGNGIWEPGVDKLYTFVGNSAGDVPVVGDWNHDGRTKIGVYRQGFWLLDLNGNGIWDSTAGDEYAAFGGAYPAYLPVVGDWNGDGRTKIGYYHNGSWALDYNGSGVSDTGDKFTTFGGSAGDIPVVGDWTGNGKAKIGIFRAGFWLLDLNGNGIWDGASGDQLTAFGGNAGEAPVVGDWNGDGRSKVGVFFGAGNWWLDANGNGKWDGYAVDFSSTFGTAGDSPVIGKWSIGGPSLPNSLNINNTGLSTGHGGAGTQTLTFNYRDISGAANIQSGQVEFIDSTPAGNPRCSFQWQRPNILNIYSTGASTNILGTTISDGFCSVALTSITNSPTDPFAVAVTVSVAFQQDYPGSYGAQTYGVQTQLADLNGFQTSWGQVGTWTVDQTPIGPFSGSGGTQTFTLSAADPNGQAYTSITNVQLNFNWSPNAIDGCFLSYDTVSDKLYLADKTGNLSVFPPISLKIPGGILGSIAQNTSNCQIDGSASSISGQGTSLYLNLKTTFNSTFIGKQNTYVQVSDNLTNGQAVLQGSWTAYPAPSSTPPTSILPSGLNIDGTHTMTFTYDDLNGFNFVPGMYVQIGQVFDDPGNCRFIYWRGTGANNHIVNLYADTWSAFLGQAPVGQPGAILASTNRCTVNLGSSYVGENGTRGALNLVVDLKNALPNGQVTVWTLPVDRQNAHAAPWPSSTFSIAAADFKLEPVPDINIQQTATPAAQGFQVPVSVFGNFAGTVAFSCQVPAGVTVSCSGPIPTGPGSNLANFSFTPTGSGAVNGTITITGTSGSLSHPLTIPLTISAAPPPPSVSFSGSQILTTTPGGSAVFAMTVTGNNGWTQPIILSATNANFYYDFCVYTSNTCAGTAYGSTAVTVTPPATVFFKVTDRTNIPGTIYPLTTYFTPVVQLPGQAITGISGTRFTLITQQGTVPPSYTFTAPTQITVPAGGTVTSTVSIVQQGSFTGAVALTSPGGLASFGQPQLSLSSSIPAASTSVTFSAGSQPAGTYQQSVCAGIKCQPVQMTVKADTTPSPIGPDPPPIVTYVIVQNAGIVVYNDGNPVTFVGTCPSNDCGSVNSCRIGSTITGPGGGGSTGVTLTTQATASQIQLTVTAAPSAYRGIRTLSCNNLSVTTYLTVEALPSISSLCVTGDSSCAPPVVPEGTTGRLTINGRDLLAGDYQINPVFPDIAVYQRVVGDLTVGNGQLLSVNLQGIQLDFQFSNLPPAQYTVSVFPHGRNGNLASSAAKAPNNKATFQVRTNATVTSVCDYGGQDGCPQPQTTPNQVKQITINGTGLVGSSGATPAVTVTGPNGETLNAQVDAASATRIDASVTVPYDAAITDYDVSIYPNGASTLGNSFSGTSQFPSGPIVIPLNKLRVVDFPIITFLVHGIGQDQSSMSGLANNLYSQGLPVDSGFSFSECAQSTSCGASRYGETCGIDAGAKSLARYIRIMTPYGARIVLLGYSMGGLIARQMIAKGYLTNPLPDRNGNILPAWPQGKVIGLITLGTPHLGYPYDPVDRVAQCGLLLDDMKGSWSPLYSTELSNTFLDNLRPAWSSAAFKGYWFAAGGSQCSNPIRNVGVSIPLPGCLGTALSDGVVCLDSATYTPPGPFLAFASQPYPGQLFTDPNHLYVHTTSGGGWGTFGLLCGNAFSNATPIFNPDVREDLFITIVRLIKNGQ